ncbi:MAG: NifB/NifX family molybdenum-iron cluster-binding protein [Candidatus Marinimicrobia bacterium]|jgi:predicted Fe-Mo cluster-binding NifX family protein|nr:NifB/NifX family molybdenum-iron cluster-binding protein [Candidatus Neomarinimicrobiota bacterium]MBT4361738.1 NifB/NifX family molybdenum-iron cluster-binding protein [Candidatus Neomarinimicrobiota bacterium]MBT4715870.1 NifB/NifX family molybdenum-iron cluster-binding protein [Candidatus Neomarinimicrobiota bacterium]MBT4947789.1 NifB/NifX family molybdenum-iron cluster-binding protein [Candidatus Neomarinimicrobiota bacterium]MBT5271276.1 NifB/NifX family molybdenum-iron cluster-binding
MKKLFAIPTEDGIVCEHFGRCEKFSIVVTENDNIVEEKILTPPVHEPGVYPKFLKDNSVDVVICGGLGVKAQQLFAQQGIGICIGATSMTPPELVNNYISGQLSSGTNLCDQ